MLLQYWYCLFVFFQAEDGIRDLVRSRGLGDVYKRQKPDSVSVCSFCGRKANEAARLIAGPEGVFICDECVRLCQEILNEENLQACLLYTSDAADERSSVDLGGRPIIKKKNYQ